MTHSSKLALLAALLAATALADVGHVSTLDGAATRTPKGGPAQPLTTGAALALGDTITVSAGVLKLELTDGSVIALDTGSTFELTEAEFEGQERKAFSGFLKAGSLWTKVKKALGGAKFEVTTERAVAGVRGTIFRIDADALVKAAKGKGAGRKVSIVRVVEGVVNVHPTKAMVTQAVPSRAAKAGPRTQVSGPTEISKDEWEKRFVDLQQNSQIAVGVDLWEQAEYEEAAKRDAFARWIEQHP